MDKRNQFTSNGERFYTAAIFDETNSADVCLCQEGSTRVVRVIARIYNAEFNEFRIL